MQGEGILSFKGCQLVIELAGSGCRSGHFSVEFALDSPFVLVFFGSHASLHLKKHLHQRHHLHVVPVAFDGDLGIWTGVMLWRRLSVPWRDGSLAEVGFYRV